MSKISDWIIGMEETASNVSREEFIRRYGAGQAIVWDRIHGPYQQDEECWGYEEDER